MISVKKVQADINSLPKDYKTADVDRLIAKYVKAGENLSPLREYVLDKQQFHRIYFHGSLKQIKEPNDRFMWLDENLLFTDWWHTDENIVFVKGVDFKLAYKYAKKYVKDKDPFIRRWGYVMFISRYFCSSKDVCEKLFLLMHNDDEYYVQMAEAWLLCEIAICFPDEVYKFLESTSLKYNITGKALKDLTLIARSL